MMASGTSVKWKLLLSSAFYRKEIEVQRFKYSCPRDLTSFGWIPRQEFYPGVGSQSAP